MLCRAVLALPVVLGPLLSLHAEVRLEPPLVRQAKNGCGAASLAMVLGYWAAELPGVELQSPERIYAQMKAAEDGGLPLAEMKRFLQDHGFNAFTVRSTFEDVETHLSKRRPLIAALDHGSRAGLHYVVLSGFDDKRVRLHDPARSKPKRVSRKKFQKQWEAADRWLLIAAPKP